VVGDPGTGGQESPPSSLLVTRPAGTSGRRSS
jgi:hypothetical protein